MGATGRQRLFKPFVWVAVAAGAAALLVCLARIQFAQLNLAFLPLALFTALIGSRLTVKIPRVHGEITVADSLVFLTALLYDGEAAVLVAVVEAICSSLRVSRKARVVLFNSAVMACSTFLTVHAVRTCFGPLAGLATGESPAALVTAVCLMALVQYLANSGLAAAYTALKTDQPVWLTWRRFFLWTSVTYFAGAAAAGIIAYLIGTLGFRAAFAVAPIVAIVYVTYSTYLKNLALLQESEERFRSAFDYAAIGMALVAPDGRWLQVNRSLCELVGYTEHELLATDFQSLTHPDDIDEVVGHARHVLEGRNSTFQVEKRYLHKSGRAVWAYLNISRIHDSQSNSSRLIFQIQDITDRRRAEEQLLHDAMHDGLTGLPNRALFLDRLKLAIARAGRRDDYHFSVLFLDLDRFKTVNDSLGHLVGDQLLIGITRRLETCLRAGDTVARLGGDEFTILLDDVGGADDVHEVTERIRAELGRPFNLGGHEVFTSVSIGVAPSTVGYERADDVLRDADTAMYRAKALGRARHVIFDKEMHARAVNLLQLETDLRRAVERREFEVHYQPIVLLNTGRLHSFEALVRWRHPKHGLISPMDFIPVAEDTGLIVPIGHWVLAEACRQACRWQKQFPARGPISVSVNLSAKQFAQPDLAEQVRGVLEETGLEPHCLKLEITESVVMENSGVAVEMLARLRVLGVELSIDDFGTGYSSLSYLHRFPVSTLKIDRSFVNQMHDNDENTELVRTIITLARTLGMEVVAEGVETERQLAQLRELECEHGQGYYFARPMEAAAVEVFLADTSKPQLKVAYATPHAFLQGRPSRAVADSYEYAGAMPELATAYSHTAS
jgi:diguanylate cyclase (GGDEF)-like protein/PAS domain S-box-containing protein